MRLIQYFIKNGTKPTSKTFRYYFVAAIKQTNRPKVLHSLHMRLYRYQGKESLIYTLERINIASMEELVKHLKNIRLQSQLEVLEKAQGEAIRSRRLILR